MGDAGNNRGMRRYTALALILLLLIPVAAESTGSLSLPVVFGSLPSGAHNFSQLDTNYNAIRDYVNNREISFGLLTARPAASIAGRWFYATDTSQLFADTGSAWTQVGGASVTGLYAVRGLQGANNTATPLTQFDMSADQVALRNPTDNSISVRTNTGTLTNNTALAGPAANGRDVAAAFTGNTWLHFYFIWNGTTLATLSSTTAPPTGPALPTGYTSWAYAGFVRYGTGTGGSLIRTRWRGTMMYYDVATTVVSNGTAIIETTVSVASAVAPNATSMGLAVGLVNTAVGSFFIRTVSGQNFWPTMEVPAGLSFNNWFQLELPNLSQQFFFQFAAAPSSGATFSVINATMPNGGP